MHRSCNAILPLATNKALHPTTRAQCNIQVRTLSLQDYLCEKTRPKFLREMRESLIEIGTFYIKDHGVPTNLEAEAMEVVRDYFALPLEEKKKMLIGNSRHFRGYKLIGDELTNNQVDHREQLQFAPERPALESFIPTISHDHDGLRGPNLWPESTTELLPQFKPCILEFMNQLETLSQHIMEAIALSLDLDASYFHDLFGADPYYRLKCAKYPSVPLEKEAKIGCGAHKDTGFLTVLLQDMVGGLQGQDPVSGQWMDTKPISGTFIVTMGEAIERLTGGLYHATVHRVLNNTSGRDRYSIPFFFDPALDARVPHQLPIRCTDQEKTFGKSSSLCALPTSDQALGSGDVSSDEDLETLVDALDIHDRLLRRSSSSSTSSVSGTWSNGEHIFETVKRCHPEVYSR
ncbi:hypothetical protein BGW38_006779, partial [Lunasporangiospora selenospora]